MADCEDMFQSQQGYSSEEDDTYTRAASEIAIRKIKLEQAKEKGRALCQELKNLIEERKRAYKERDRVKKEDEALDLEKEQRKANLHRLQETRKTLAAALEDLKTKVNTKEAETQAMAARMQAKLKAAEELYEKYLEGYNQFPLAVKLRGLEAKKKNILIEISLAKMALQDLKEKSKLMEEITRQRRNAWVVKLAKMYKERQEKIAKMHELLKKKKELTQLYEDLKSGKVTPSKEVVLTPAFPQPIVPGQVLSKPDTFSFKMPRLQISSSKPSGSSESSTKPGSLSFDWESLCKRFNFGSQSISKIQPTKKDDVKPKETVNLIQKSASQPTGKEHLLEKPLDATLLSTSNNQGLSVVQTTSILQKRSNDSNSKIKSNQDASSAIKRKSSDSNEENNSEPCTKKPSFQSLELRYKTDKSTIQHPTVEPKSKEVELTKVQSVDTKECLPSNKTIINNENVQVLHDINYNDPNCIKTKNTVLSSQINNKTRNSTVTQMKTKSLTNLSQILNPNNPSMKQKKVKHHKLVEYPKSINSCLNPKNSTNLAANIVWNTEENPTIARKKYQENNTISNKENLTNVENENPPDEGMLMSPNSPPDIVPVGNNSQPLAQPPPQPKPLPISQLSPSDFISPLELNDEEMANYKQFLAESPGDVYDKISPMTQDIIQHENIVVKSKYFANNNPRSQQSQDKELNTPDVTGGADQCKSPQGGYQNYVLSPPMTYLSPPSANLGAANKENSAEKFLFDSGIKESGSKSPEGGFSFNFGSSKPSSSIFSLF